MSSDEPKKSPVKVEYLPRFMRRWIYKTTVRTAILIRITHVKQIFNSFDPSPFHERDIDADAEQYILTMAESLAYEEEVPDVIQINVHLGQLPTNAEYFELFRKRVDTMLRPSSIFLTSEELDSHGQVVAKHESRRTGITVNLKSPRPATSNTVLSAHVVKTQQTPLADLFAKNRPATMPGSKTASPLMGTISSPPSPLFMPGQAESDGGSVISDLPALNLQPSAAAIIINMGPGLSVQAPTSSPRSTWTTREQDLLQVLSEDLKMTLGNHFAFQAQLVSNEIRRIVSTGRTAAIFGFTVMLCALTLSSLVLSIPSDEEAIVQWPGMISNALEILAWVVWWKPIEMIVYGWWPLLQKRRTLNKLSQCDLKVFHDGNGNAEYMEKA